MKEVIGSGQKRGLDRKPQSKAPGKFEKKHSIIWGGGKDQREERGTKKGNMAARKGDERRYVL